MNIVVCIKQVPGTSEVEVDPQTGVLIRDGIAVKMNPYDLFALETALKIKEQYGATIHTLTMGPPQAKTIIYESYMLGADKGYILTDKTFAGADVLATAYTLTQGVQKICQPDLIICGKMTTDGDTAQVGPEMAEFLHIPHITNVKKIIDLNDKSLTVEIDNGYAYETLEISLPCLITVEKDIYMPRLPSYKLKLATAQREVEQITFSDLPDQDKNHYGLNGSPTQVKRIFNPESNNERETWQGISEQLSQQLLAKLTELKYIGE